MPAKSPVNGRPVALAPCMPGREPDDDQARAGIAERRHRQTPIRRVRGAHFVEEAREAHATAARRVVDGRANCCVCHNAGLFRVRAHPHLTFRQCCRLNRASKCGSRLPAGRSRKPPLLFVHGGYCDAWFWEPYFLPWFAARGLRRLRTEPARARRERRRRDAVRCRPRRLRGGRRARRRYAGLAAGADRSLDGRRRSSS